MNECLDAGYLMVVITMKVSNNLRGGRKHTWTVIETKFLNHNDEKSLHLVVIQLMLVLILSNTPEQFNLMC